MQENLESLILMNKCDWILHKSQNLYKHTLVQNPYHYFIESIAGWHC